MRAMVLAAGRGERMRPLTDHCPKPLLSVGGQPLITWHLQALAQAGIRHILINHAWLGKQIEATLGDGSHWGVHLQYSPEPQPLETAGGIARALPFFQDQPFLVVNGDIWCDWPPTQARLWADQLPAHVQAHLLLVDNPAHHPAGDFILHPDGLVDASPANPHPPRLTFAGIGLYRPSLFATTAPDHPAPLAPLLRQAMASQAVQGSHYPGRWVDVGTPQRLEQLNHDLKML